MVGTIYVHDGRPGTVRGGDPAQRDVLDLGPVLMMCRARRQLRVGDEIRVPTGEIFSVHRSRCWHNGRRWEQSVLIGETVPTVTSHPSMTFASGLPTAS